MSTLARHTRHLAADPRASLLLTEEAERGDPLNHPRLTLNGRIERAAEPRARTRYLQRNPKAKLYADFADFAFFRLAIESVHFNGGFGRADALTPADILASREGEAALAEAEARLIDWVNGLGDEAVARLAGRRPSGRQVWRAVGLDAEGLDLAAGGQAARVQFGSCARCRKLAVAAASRDRRDGPRAVAMLSRARRVIARTKTSPAPARNCGHGWTGGARIAVPRRS